MIRIEHDQFIGHYINALPIEVCNRFIEWYDLIESSGIATPAMNCLLYTSDAADE